MNESIRNICKERFNNKRVTVVGIGVSNIPLIDFLLSFGAKVTACDRKDFEKLGDIAKTLEQKGIKLSLGNTYIDNIEADFVFRSPGIRNDIPQFQKALENGAVLCSEMELFFELCPCNIIAITGSDGKTTTTTLVSEILKKDGKNVFLGGNIGAPLLPFVFDMNKDDFAVVELSSFQLQTMKKSPHTAIMTNITPNHLNWHVDYDEYIDAKSNIWKYQNENDRLVLNAENEVTLSISKKAHSKCVMFSSKNTIDGVYEQDGKIYSHGKLVMNTSDIKLPGRHNVENYMAAIAALDGVVSYDSVKYVANNFGGVEHRIELVRTMGGVKYYNSSIDSSPNRTIAALGAFDQKLIVLCGGEDKHIPYDEIGEPLCQKAKIVITNGPTGPLIDAAVRKAPSYKEGAPELYKVQNYKEATLLAHKLAKDGDIVLLSPASTSFDAFDNFMQRGNFFKELVNSL